MVLAVGVTSSPWPRRMVVFWEICIRGAQICSSWTLPLTVSFLQTGFPTGVCVCRGVGPGGVRGRGGWGEAHFQRSRRWLCPEGLARLKRVGVFALGDAASVPGGLLPGLLCSPVPHFFELASTTLTPWLTPQCPCDSHGLLASLSPWMQLSRGAASTFVFAPLVPDGHWGLRLACPSVWLGFWPRPRPWLSPYAAGCQGRILGLLLFPPAPPVGLARSMINT